MLLGLCDGCS